MSLLMEELNLQIPAYDRWRIELLEWCLRTAERLTLQSPDSDFLTLFPQSEGPHLQSRHAPAAGGGGQQHPRGHRSSSSTGLLVCFRAAVGDRARRLVWARLWQRQEEEKSFVAGGVRRLVVTPVKLNNWTFILMVLLCSKCIKKMRLSDVRRTTDVFIIQYLATRTWKS